MSEALWDLVFKALYKNRIVLFTIITQCFFTFLSTLSISMYSVVNIHQLSAHCSISIDSVVDIHQLSFQHHCRCQCRWRCCWSWHRDRHHILLLLRPLFPIANITPVAIVYSFNWKGGLMQCLLSSNLWYPLSMSSISRDGVTRLSRKCHYMVLPTLLVSSAIGDIILSCGRYRSS